MEVGETSDNDRFSTPPAKDEKSRKCDCGGFDGSDGLEHMHVETLGDALTSPAKGIGRSSPAANSSMFAESATESEDFVVPSTSPDATFATVTGRHDSGKTGHIVTIVLAEYFILAASIALADLEASSVQWTPLKKTTDVLTLSSTSMDFTTPKACKHCEIGIQTNFS
jgi:hypothetical protein